MSIEYSQYTDEVSEFGERVQRAISKELEFWMDRFSYVTQDKVGKEEAAMGNRILGLQDACLIVHSEIMKLQNKKSSWLYYEWEAKSSDTDEEETE